MPPTAAILVIGNEILSGKTQDINTQFIATRLSDRGIKLCEVRIIRDEEAAIVEATRTLSAKYTYVFSTGGIGPTHDDITADCMAKAFNTQLDIHPEAKRMLAAYCQEKGVELTEGRLRMARIPVGADLLFAENTAAPGFKISNVYVMAGVPKIMQSMFMSFEHTLVKGDPVLTRTISCNAREGDIAIDLEKIQNDFPTVEIGSYPHMGQTPSLSLVLRATHQNTLEKATQRVFELAKSLDTSSVIA